MEHVGKSVKLRGSKLTGVVMGYQTELSTMGRLMLFTVDWNNGTSGIYTRNEISFI